MVQPSIVKDGVTFTFESGEVEDVSVNKAGRLDETTLPGSDSDDTFVIDFNGVLKTITLTGSLFETDSTRTDSGTTTTIEQQMAWLIALVDGAQEGYTFNSNYQTSKTVYCRRVNFREEQGTPNHVPFTIEFVEGS